MMAISPAIVIALVDSPCMRLRLRIVWARVQFSAGNLISPNVISRTITIHPLTIIFVLLIGGNLFGIVGIILGIPRYAILKVLVTYVFKKFRQQYDKYYAKDAGPYTIDESNNK